MGAFDHVTVLLSFVYALALTHLLSRIGSLIVARRSVTFSGFLALAMANAMVAVYANWLGLWELRGLTSWDIVSITTQFLFVAGIFLVSLMAAPEAGELDMEDYYARQHRAFYLALAATLLVGLAANAALLKTPNAAHFLYENAAALLMLVPTVVAFFAEARWAQWASGIALLMIQVGSTIVFVGKLA